MAAETGVDVPGRASISEKTLRPDRWWVAPLLTFLGLSTFVLYAAIRASTQKYYWVDEFHYLTPFASPCITESCEPGSSHFGTWLGEFPPLIPLAILTLPFLLGFRLTCYYYRKAYYRAFWLSPPACAVPEPHGKYTGETRFPLIIQNAHRYFFFAAFIISLINTYDAVLAFHSGGDGPNAGFGFGLGNVVLMVNLVLLWSYTMGCHSCRHITAGRINHFSKHPVRYWLYQRATWLNGRHMLLAWLSLGMLIFTDAYIWFVSAGYITDLRFIG